MGLLIAGVQTGEYKGLVWVARKKLPPTGASRAQSKRPCEAQGKPALQIAARWTDSAGAEGCGEGQVGLEAAIDLDGGVAGADDLLMLAPGGETWEVFAEERVGGLHGGVVGANQAQATM